MNRRVQFAKDTDEFGGCNEMDNAKKVYNGSKQPLRQRKIYEVWPGGNQKKLPFIPNAAGKATEESYTNNNTERYATKHGPVKHMGSSGSVSFQSPHFQSNNNNMSMYHSVGHPCQSPSFNPNYWWSPVVGDSTGFPQHMQMNPDIYGYGIPSTPNMFQECPSTTYISHPGPMPQRSIYGYQSLYPEPLKNEIQRPIASQNRLPKLQGSSNPHTSTHRPGTSIQKKNDVTPIKKDKIERPKPRKIFVSTNARGLKAWSEVKQDTMVIFEIIGVLNSQVSEEVKHCKSFLIKDGQGYGITCEFFETDRRMRRTCRGKMYRCVGDYSVRRGVFHAVCVREAEERDVRLYRKLVAVANVALKNFKEQFTSKR